MVTIRVPAPPPGLLANLLGLAGLVAIIVAIGALTSWPWALLAAGVFAVALAWLASVQQQAPAVRSAAPVRPIRSGASAVASVKAS